MVKITLGQSIKIRNMIVAGQTPEQVAAQYGITAERVKGFCFTKTVKRKKKSKEALTEPVE